ncbi:MAG: tRNA glutamyl-Q(34) synthetase GluQRS [Betaproteobacteria bacterium]|nr:tRNA glutamyl-Q(34) synthetase GluQRS [Betaproteobacteria bacterium]MDE2309233.1 tRNA glutamyl-Q(34) synthetase GluQRS [Betaproteobacteria bacterium]
MERSDYRGRFAPSPTGPLHFGSLVAALGSYLDAKHHNGTWLVRIEDLDTPRTVKGAADDILRTLEACGLHWDETVIYQSRRTTAYQAAFEQLRTDNLLYPCACSRKEITDSALHGIDGQIYPGTCRKGVPAGREGRAWRVRADDQAISFDDALQGRITQHLESEIGDFVVKRADGLFAYQLAVVVDDAAQGITHVVRGADLLTSTARQIYLQRLLGFATPAYTHLPIAVNAQGEKLGKQTLAAPVGTHSPVATLLRALAFLRQELPAELLGHAPESVLIWAIAHWNKDRLKGIMNIPV